MAYGDSPVTPESWPPPAVLVSIGDGAPVVWLRGKHDQTTADPVGAAIVSGPERAGWLSWST